MQVSHLILKYVICYSVFFIISLLAKSNNGYKLFDEEGPVRNTGSLLGLQIAGILWLGVIPCYIFRHSFSAIVFGNEIPRIFQIFILLLLSVTIMLIVSKQSRIVFDKITVRQTAIQLFNSSFVFRYIFLRSVFLFSYEIFFRGFLLTDCIQYLGTAKAIFINVLFYTLLHLPGNKKELFACIPFGILLCATCIWFNAAWPAIVLHLFLSFTHDIILIQKFSKRLNTVI